MIIHITFFNLTSGIYLNKNAQIASLLIKEVKILDKYLDFTNVFLKEKVLVLPEHSKLNGHVIDLENSKQLLYKSIYSLGPVELKTLKTYIETHLKTVFIWLSKYLVGVFILFDKKPDGIFHLYVNYQDFNNLTIKNQYPLPLIAKSLN